jgi:molecular chaperone GrpE
LSENIKDEEKNLNETVEVDEVEVDEKSENRDERDIEIEELQKKLKESEDKYVRVFSEFENYKKRLEKEKYQAIEYASEKFAKDLLPVLDNLQMAIQSAETTPDVDKLKEGVELTLKNFLSTLQKNGVESIDTEDGFDPNLHEAVMRVDSADAESGEIVQVLQSGYRLKERVLRATMVSVAN